MDSLISITFYDVKIENPPLYVSTLLRFSFTVSYTMILNLFFLKSTRGIKMYCSLCLKILSFTLFNI